MTDITGEEGETLEIDYEVTNNGDKEDTQDIVMTKDDGTVAEVDRHNNITLDTSQSNTGTLTWATGEGDAGTYTIEVSSNDNADSITVEVTESLPVIHHYDPAEFTSSLWPDEVGLSDMDTISGVTFNSSAFGGYGGVSGDGTGYTQSNQMGDWGSNLGGDWACAFGFSSSSYGDWMMGIRNNNDSVRFQVSTGAPGASTSGAVTMYISDANGNEVVFETSATGYADGGEYAFIFQKSGSNYEIWESPTSEISSLVTDDGVSSFSNFDVDMTYFAENDAGNVTDNDIVDLSSIAFFDKDLVESERETVFNRYFPWYSY